ncbi:MAG: VanZ family protein [Planctomycetota bacterium]
MRWTLIALAYMAALFLLSSIPDDSELGRRILFPPPAVQNLLHVPVYAGLTWLWWRSLKGKTSPRPAVLCAAAIAIGYGVLDEIHQMYVPGRFASVTDALLNAAGAAAVVAWVFLRAPEPGPG